MRLPNLPAFRGVKTIISKDQSTADIMQEVYNAHFAFKQDYDKLADYFTAHSPVIIAKKLFTFCKNNIAYKIESENLQTTRSPAGILYLKNGDCKHYAGFIAGVLDAVRRYTNEKFKIAYRFASYDAFDLVPAHVFVVLFYNGNEYWIDPVLENFNQRTPQPSFIKDKIIPMALVRLAGLGNTQNLPAKRNISGPYDAVVTQITETFNPQTPYDKAAAVVGQAANAAVSLVPFASIAQGLLSNFFGGQGGLADWLSPAGIINEVKAIIFGRLFRGGQYWLGEKFKYYVMGENIHTRDADIVGDTTVSTAITTFSIGFGVPIDDYQDILNLQKGANAYIARYVQLGQTASKIPIAAVNRAVLLKQQYFPTEYENNWTATGVAPKKWNMADFNKIPFAVPIPDFTKPYAQQWDYTYTGKIPLGEVVNGVVIAGALAAAAAPINPAATASKNNMLLIVGGAAALAAGYFLLKKKR